MTVPIVYKSTDTDAPVLCGTDTSLVSVIKACLVDGYGTKAAAGWTMEFSNAGGTKAAFRNNPITGTGFFIQIDGEGLDRYPIIRTYENMTSEVDGLFFINSCGSNSYQKISSTADSVARPWVIVATDKFIYFFCYSGATSMPVSWSDCFNAGASINFLIGDFKSNYLTDGYNFFSGFTYDYGYPSFGSGAPSSATNGLYQYTARDITGTAKQTVVTCVNPPGGSGNHAIGSTGSNSEYTAETGVLLSEVMINQGVANSIRGWLPNVLAPLVAHPYTNLQEVEIDSVPYIYVMGRSYKTNTIGVFGLLFKLAE